MNKWSVIILMFLLLRCRHSPTDSAFGYPAEELTGEWTVYSTTTPIGQCGIEQSLASFTKVLEFQADGSFESIDTIRVDDWVGATDGSSLTVTVTTEAICGTDTSDREFDYTGSFTDSGTYYVMKFSGTEEWCPGKGCVFTGEYRARHQK